MKNLRRVFLFINYSTKWIKLSVFTVLMLTGSIFADLLRLDVRFDCLTSYIAHLD